MNIAPYRKFVVAAVGAALTWAIATYANDPDINKWLSLASAVLTALGVYQVPNESK
jgi:hypothetical protein